MTLIAIVLALLLEKVLSYSSTWRAHDLTERWMRWVNSVVGVQSWSLVLWLLVPVGLVALLDRGLAAQPGGVLLQLPLALLVLLASLGPRDLLLQIHAYQAARARGDDVEAQAQLEGLLAGPLRARSGDSQVGRSPVAGCFVQGHERWFAILIWFFLLGSAGVAAYAMLRSITLHLREEGYAEDSLKLADWLHEKLAWPSSRVAALCFALAGSADEAFSWWRQSAADWRGHLLQRPWPLVANVGLAAMTQDPDDPDDDGDDLDAAMRLLARSLRLLLALIALLTIGGWLA